VLAISLLGGVAAICVLAAVVVRLRARLRDERERTEALRAALDASVWEDRIREVDRLEATVRELRQRGHEVNNVLSTALLSTQLFFDAGREDPVSANATAELEAAADGMVDALQRLKLLIEVGRRSDTTIAPRSLLIRPVELLGILTACAERVRARHPRTALVVHPPASDVAAVRVSVCGGRTGLERALVAVLDNACEGDGVKTASKVDVRIGVSSEVDVVALEVADDGPGFTKTQLDRPIAVFDDTKPGALGVGLYTAERIARGSGGSLRRENAEGGGARVSLFLPVSL